MTLDQKKLIKLIESATLGKFTKVAKGLYFTKDRLNNLLTIEHLTDSDYIGTSVHGQWRVSDDNGDAVDVSTYREAKRTVLTWGDC